MNDTIFQDQVARFGKLSLAAVRSAQVGFVRMGKVCPRQGLSSLHNCDQSHQRRCSLGNRLATVRKRYLTAASSHLCFRRARPKVDAIQPQLIGDANRLVESQVEIGEIPVPDAPMKLIKGLS